LGDPVSWILIEKGWRVEDANGEELGKVDAITGDEDADVFDGLAVEAHFLEKPRYVPSDSVGSIEQGVVKLKLSREAFAKDETHEKPPESLEIEPEEAPRSDRMIESVSNFFRGFRRKQ
jgi:hypothetical protein